MIRKRANLKRSATNTVNADMKTTIPGKLWWFLSNFFNILNPPGNSSHLSTFPFNTEISDHDFANIDLSLSPPRALSDIFLTKLKWDSLQRELNGIRIFDTGCGNGAYSRILIDASNHLINQYFGIDMVENPNWPNISRDHQNVHFSVGSSDSINHDIPDDCNFLFTHSSLEHFKDDLTFFRHIRTHIDTYKKPVIQLHFLPSPICIGLYPLHGYRQYSKSSIHKIVSLFNSSDTSAQLYGLGGWHSNILHFNYITKGLITRYDYREHKNSYYRKKLRKAIRRDCSRQSIMPTYYALTIYSHCNPNFSLL